MPTLFLSLSSDTPCSLSALARLESVLPPALLSYCKAAQSYFVALPLGFSPRLVAS